MRFLTLFLTTLLLLTACTATTQPTHTPADSASPSPTAAVNSTFETSLLVTEWRGESEGNVLFPLNPASGSALPDYTPIALGRIYFYTFSSDRQTLAVVSFPSDNTINGSLLLIDLPAWKLQRFELGLIGWVSTMVFSPDGKRLAIAHGDMHKLRTIDVEKGVILVQGHAEPMVTQMKFTANGEALMLYGQVIQNRFTENEIRGGSSQVLLLDAADLSPHWSVELEEVHDGIYPKDEIVTPASFHEPGQARYISPGLAFAADRDMLYVIHADSEQLTSVDFEHQKVETVEIQDKLTLVEQLLSLTADIAHAKIADGTSKQAVISPDGKFLYVIGTNHTSFQDQQGNWQMEQTTLGLEIIQTRDGKRVNRFDTDATELSISPDGKFLYLRNWGDNAEYLPWTEVFDISSQQIVTRRAAVFAMPALLVNGGFLLASTYSTSETSHHMSVMQPDASSLLAEWTGSTYVWWLTTR